MENSSLSSHSRGDGRALLVVALLVLGAAVIMIGRVWHERTKNTDASPSTETALVDLRFLTPENVLERMRNNEPLHFIDIRSRDGYEVAHLLDSQWVNESEIETYMPPLGATVIVVFGTETPNAVLLKVHEIFTKNKFTFAFLEGGINNWIAQGGGVVSRGDPNSYIDQSKVISIMPQDLQGLATTLVSARLIDVRSEREFEEGHIDGAVNLPMSRLERDRGSLPKIGSLIVYGNTTDDGFLAGTALFDMGFVGVRVMEGGFTAWKEQGFPVFSTPLK